jgi:hypothetical protein
VKEDQEYINDSYIVLGLSPTFRRNMEEVKRRSEEKEDLRKRLELLSLEDRYDEFIEIIESWKELGYSSEEIKQVVDFALAPVYKEYYKELCDKFRQSFMKIVKSNKEMEKEIKLFFDSFEKKNDFQRQRELDSLDGVLQCKKDHDKSKVIFHCSRPYGRSKWQFRSAAGFRFHKIIPRYGKEE